MQRNRQNLSALGEQIRRLRKERGLSQEQLAERSGVTTNFIGLVERGERAASVLVLIDIGHALNVHPVQIFEGCTFKFEGSPASD